MLHMVTCKNHESPVPKALFPHPVTYFMPALHIQLLSTYYVPGTVSRPGFFRRFYRWKGTQFLPSQRGWMGNQECGE